MKTLVIAEHDNASLKPATLNAVAAASALGGDIDILVAGGDCAAAAEAAAKIPGVTNVLVADNAAYAHQLPRTWHCWPPKWPLLTIMCSRLRRPGART